MEAYLSITAKIQYEGKFCGVGPKRGSFECEFGSGGHCHLFRSNRATSRDPTAADSYAWTRVSDCVEATATRDSPKIEPTPKTIYERLQEG